MLIQAQSELLGAYSPVGPEVSFVNMLTLVRRCHSDALALIARLHDVDRIIGCLAWLPDHGARMAHGIGTYVDPAFRGTGVSTALRMMGIDRCRALGLRQVLGSVSIENLVGLKSCLDLGFNKVGWVVALKIPEKKP